jgi:Zn-dependent protease with chaperone function
MALLLPACGHGQPTYRLSSGLGGALADYEEKSIPGWPQVLEQEQGTVVYINFRFSTAEVWIASRRQFGLDRLTDATRQTLSAMGVRASRIGTWEGTKTCVTKVEVQKFVERKGLTSTCSIDIHRLLGALRAAQLEAPIGFIAGPYLSDSLVVTLGGNSQEGQLAWLDGQVAPGDRLTFARDLSWWNVLIGSLMFALVPLSIGSVLLSPWSRWRDRFAKPNEDVVETPGEVQEKYNQTRPTRVWLLFLLIIPFSFLFLLLPGSLEEAALFIRFLPDISAVLTSAVCVALAYFLSNLLAKRYYQQRAAPGSQAAELPESEWESTSRFVPSFFLGALVVFLHLLLLFSVFPQFPRTVSAEYGRVAFMALLLSGPVMGVFSGVLCHHLLSRRLYVRLVPGDEWFDESMALAAKAGVRVRSVDVAKRRQANASVALGGRLRLNSGLLSSLDRDEVRAVIAHELGHIHGRHLAKGVALLVLSLVAFNGVRALVFDALVPSSDRGASLTGALGFGTSMLFLVVFMIVFVRVRRRHEDYADRFSLKLIGDVTIVESALTKVHALSMQPFVLKPEDEKLMSHPSLENRIRRLREHASGQSAATGQD